MLHPTSRPCIDAARVLYCGIVDEVERNDYQVFTQRAKVPVRRRLEVALPAYVRARRARRGVVSR
jgi:phytoene synthase